MSHIQKTYSIDVYESTQYDTTNEYECLSPPPTGSIDLIMGFWTFGVCFREITRPQVFKNRAELKQMIFCVIQFIFRSILLCYTKP